MYVLHCISAYYFSLGVVNTVGLIPFALLGQVLLKSCTKQCTWRICFHQGVLTLIDAIASVIGV